MKPVTFAFNRWNIFFRLLPVTISIAFGTSAEFRVKRITGHFDWYLIFACALAYLAFFVFMIVKYFMPGFRRGIVLELDDEKLEDSLNKKTIYWKDVRSIEPGTSSFSTMHFKMKDTEDFSMDLNMVKGRNSKISNAILSCYKNSEASAA